MQKPPREHAPPSQGHIITPASARSADGRIDPAVIGYATHTGAARSMEDVTVRRGTAPIIERGEADDDEIEDALADSIPASGNAPD
jgi:hypothetical protein